MWLPELPEQLGCLEYHLLRQASPGHQDHNNQVLDHLDPANLE